MSRPLPLLAAARSLLVACLLVSCLACGAGNVTVDSLEFPSADSGFESRPAFWSLPVSLIEPYLGWNVYSGRRSGYVVAVARNGHLRYATAHGYEDIESRVPMRMDTRFRIASMTKPVVGVAALILLERGLLALDDPVSQYIPAFADVRVAVSTEAGADGVVEGRPLLEPMSVRDLLTFRTGIGGAERSEWGSDLDRVWREHSDSVRVAGSLEQVAEEMAKIPLWEEPGEKWRYGRDLEVMARVVEVASGELFEDFVEREIFAPLGMNDTSFLPPPDRREGIATLYRFGVDGELEAVPELPFDERAVVRGSTGLVSSAPDYLRFALMLWNRGSYDGVRILEPRSVALMITPSVENGVLREFGIEGLGWGLAIATVTDAEATLLPDRDGDFFWSGAYGSHFFVSPETGIAMVVMQQHRFPARAARDERRGVEVPMIVQGILYFAARD
jgi:CubicO group peptidase (beta-lactamase class C family)